MQLTLYQIDAFTDTIFHGNPAAVCILGEWIDETLMQKIAEENNLAETVFVVKKDLLYEIRWFTPLVEVDLCGHATLAAAFVLFEYYGVEEARIDFYSERSGALVVEKSLNDELTMDFPADELVEVQGQSDTFAKIFEKMPEAVLKGKTDYLLIYSNQDDIESLSPDLKKAAEIKARGIIVSSPGKEVDFVSRFFAPQSGIDEDPVTGSAHTSLTPYWAQILNKATLSARQISKRGGDLKCKLLGDRVHISGKAVPYMVAKIDI